MKRGILVSLVLVISLIFPISPANAAWIQYQSSVADTFNRPELSAAFDITRIDFAISDTDPDEYWFFLNFAQAITANQFNDGQGSWAGLLLDLNNDGSRVTFSLIPTSKINTPDSMQLIENSRQRKNEVEAELIAKVLAERQAKSDAEARAAAELKAKREAETKTSQEEELRAKRASELKAQQESAAKKALIKKTTIICVKGKLTKKLTSLKPKCPSGYKVK